MSKELTFEDLLKMTDIEVLKLPIYGHAVNVLSCFAGCVIFLNKSQTIGWFYGVNNNLSICRLELDAYDVVERW